jgi:signal transduction histidine kinase
MNRDTESRSGGDLLGGGLAFFGAVTASVSHELNNVISIIDQTAGLLEDMLAGDAKGFPISMERLASVVESLQKQTGRGLQIIRRLNRFAHSADFPLTEFSVNEVMENLIGLSGRLADLKRVRLEMEPPAESPAVTGNPFLLQQIVFNIIRLFLSSAEKNDTIKIAVGRDEDNIAVIIAFSRLIGDRRAEFAGLNVVATHISGHIEVSESDNHTSVRVIVPRLGTT